MSEANDSTEAPASDTQPYSVPTGWGIATGDVERLFSYQEAHPGVSDEDACAALGITQCPIYEETPEWLRF